MPQIDYMSLPTLSKAINKLSSLLNHVVSSRARMSCRCGKYKGFDCHTTSSRPTGTSSLHDRLSHHPFTTDCNTIPSQLTVLKYARNLVVVIRRHPDEPFEVLKEIQALVLKKSNARMRLSRLHTSAFWLLLIKNTSFLISTLKPQQGYQVRPAHQRGWMVCAKLLLHPSQGLAKQPFCFCEAALVSAYDS